MRVIGLTIELVLYVFLILLLIRLVVDWVQMFARSWNPRGPVLVLLEIVFSITDPPLNALRRIMPSPNLGGMRLDLSFLVLIVLVYILRAVNRSLLL